MRDSGLELASAKCDFELALIKALRDEFARENPNAVGGCYFHWKQTLRRKLLDLGVPEDLVHLLVGENGRIDFLVLITYEEIPKGIAYIRSGMKEGTHKKLFDLFWAYFIKTFMKKTDRYDDKSGIFLFSSWNLSHLVTEFGLLEQDENGHDVLVNRTNNPLERFNRKLNENVPRHPTVQIFVESIKAICNEYVDLMRVIKLKKGRKSQHHPVVLPVIPTDFSSFKF